MTFHDEIEKIAKNKLICEFDNSDWQNFLYVAGDANTYRAGCKQCASVYLYENGTWRKE